MEDRAPRSQAAGSGWRLRATAGLRAIAAGAALWLVVAGVCGTLAATAAAARSVTAAPASRLVVSANQGKRSAALFALSPGGRPRRLGATKNQQDDPALSPKGDKLAYVQAAGATWTVWLMNANGAQQHALTKQLFATAIDQSPSWSPDGTRIVFSRATNVSYALYTIPAAGGTPRDLFISGVSPAWGPTRIAYVSPPTQRPGPVTLWTINPDGQDPTNVTTSYVVSPAWSRSGSLAYLDQPPGTRPDLVVISGGSTHRYQLPVARATAIAWSPDGSQLAIVAKSKPGAPYDVYSIGAAGKGLRRLTTNLGVLGVTWSK